ncbi:MAG: SbtA family thio(seleno)oxazole RiPP natural product precursor [bacterium]
MKKDDLKKILAGLSITGLLSGAGITASAPHAFGGSG